MWERTERRFHDAVEGVAGAGKLGTTSASPSISFALSPARASIHARSAAIGCSSSSSLSPLTPAERSTFISSGTRSAQIFQVRCRLRLAPFSMACGPWRLKSVPSASKKSLFNDLRVASNDPPGFRKRTDFILSTDDRRPYCLPRRGNRGLMQHRKEPPLIASLYR